MTQTATRPTSAGRAAAASKVRDLDPVDRVVLRLRKRFVEQVDRGLDPGEGVLLVVPGQSSGARRGVVALTAHRVIVLSGEADRTEIPLSLVNAVVPTFRSGEGRVLLRERSGSWHSLTIGRLAPFDIRPTKTFRSFCRELLDQAG